MVGQECAEEVFGAVRVPVAEDVTADVRALDVVGVLVLVERQEELGVVACRPVLRVSTGVTGR